MCLHDNDSELSDGDDNYENNSDRDDDVDDDRDGDGWIISRVRR